MEFLEKGNSLSQEGKTEEAIASYDKAISLNPEDFKAYIVRGVALEKIGKYEEAIDCYDKALSLDADGPAAYVAYLNKGYAFEQIRKYEGGKLEEAVGLLTKTSSLYPY